VVVADVLALESAEEGFDASTGKFVNMLSAGIVDPTKVTVTALRNSVSIAGLMLTTNSLVTELKDDDEEEPVEGAVA
jgi:chaperonin GroEL